ncbi:hypothetical protein KIPB_014574, partial [Kipferlia bialata]|eukprot:g14574.t1
MAVFVRRKFVVDVHLPPSKVITPLEGVKEQLNKLIFANCIELEGILIAYE